MELKINNIAFKYRRGPMVLEDINFQIKNDEVVGLVAPSGYGKSTLSKILAGYVKPTKGKVLIQGETLKKRGNYYNPIQLVFQHPEKAINPKWKLGKTLNESWAVTNELKEAMGIQDEWLERFPNELSGGELQRICVTRALGPETQFLIADEMTTMLDAVTQAQIWNSVLKIAKKQGIGLIVVSHEQALVEQICTRVIDLKAINHQVSPITYAEKNKEISLAS